MSIILSIAPYKFIPQINGGHWGIFNVEQVLSIHNEVHTLTVNDNGHDINAAFRLYPLLKNKKSRYLPYATTSTIIRLAKQVNPQYLFCHHHYMFPSTYKAARKLGIPCYIRSHNIETERFKSNGKVWWQIMKRFEAWSYRKADMVFFVTEGDREYAISNFSMNKEKAVVMPFGIDFASTPEIQEDIKHITAQQFHLNENVPWLFFMGKLDYQPNADAVELILEKILPELKKVLINFEILICGKNLPQSIQQKVEKEKHVHYIGFVPDINAVISSCNTMLNPIMSGGGVKTKVVESLAWNKNIVSTETGAMGIETSVCGNKLLLAKDNEWDAFSDLIIEAVHSRADIPEAFYDYYYINRVAERMQKYFDPAISKSTYPL